MTSDYDHMPTCLPARMLFYIAVLVIANLYADTAPAFGQTTDTVDLFLVEHPRALTIYNKYQQDISFKESRLFRPYIPMEIVQYDALMSDNFTHCMIVRIHNNMFYLIKEDEKTLAQIDKAGFNVYLARCSVVMDTVRIMQDKAVILSKRRSIALLPDSLVSGTFVRRQFLKNGRYYTEGLGRSDVYGWTRFLSRTRGETWEVPERSEALLSELLSPDLRSRIEAHLQSVNTVIGDLFKTLNQETGQALSAPQWQMVIQKDRVICRLKKSTYADQFVESAQYIVNDLDAFVRREGLSVKYVNRYIVISREP
ncbi:MAG TPA: hypothetical protein EYQ20_10275 [candidate division Zixibacteria bacterium]|nr:hypothetical protein [candidate division Zixibacteria bacterium]